MPAKLPGGLGLAGGPHGPSRPALALPGAEGEQREDMPCGAEGIESSPSALCEGCPTRGMEAV